VAGADHVGQVRAPFVEAELLRENVALEEARVDGLVVLPSVVAPTKLGLELLDGALAVVVDEVENVEVVGPGPDSIADLIDRVEVRERLEWPCSEARLWSPWM
jgi:hypothetical protein